MKHFITLPNGRNVGLGVYVRAFNELKKTPPNEMVRGFDYFAAPAGEILRKMRESITDRINRHLPHFGKGRNYAPEIEFGVRNLACDLARRVVVRESSVRHLPSKILARVAHRLHKPEDF